jgi:serine/threonine protein phosphatase PrpC
MTFYSYSLQGRRDSNEDQHLIINNIDNKDIEYDNINLIGVFDGHGGKLVSKFLKHNLPTFFKKKHNSYEKSIKYYYKTFDKLNLLLQDAHPVASTRCGSTACVGIQYYDNNNKMRLIILNCGDSRAIKCNKNNFAEQLTQDHKPNSPDERKRIEGLGGKIKFDGVDWRIEDLSLSRAFGDLSSTPYVTHEPEIYKYNISSKDKFIVFACDGLWDIMSNQEVVDYILVMLEKGNITNYAKNLAEYAYKKGSLDNITIIIHIL